MSRPLVPARTRVTLFLERYALVLITVGIIVFFATYSRTSEFYLSAPILRNVLGDQSVLIIVAMASLFPLICGEFDFSVGATATAAHVGVASATGEHGMPLAVGVAVGLGIGLIVGLVNAVLVTVVGVSGIIGTLGIGTILVGLVGYYTHGAAIVSGIPTSITDFGANLTVGVPTITLCTLVVAAVIHYVLTSTPPGRYLYSVGSNRSAAHAVEHVVLTVWRRGSRVARPRIRAAITTVKQLAMTRR